MAKKKTYDRIRHQEPEAATGDFDVPQSKVMAPPPFAPMASESSSAGFQEEEESQSGIQLKAASSNPFADADPPADDGHAHDNRDFEPRAPEAAMQLRSGGVVQRNVDHPGVELHNHFNGVLQPEAVLDLAGYGGQNLKFIVDFWNQEGHKHPSMQQFFREQDMLTAEEPPALNMESVSPAADELAPSLLKAGPHLPFDIAYLVREWLSVHKISNKDNNQETVDRVKEAGDSQGIANELNAAAGHFDARRVMVYALSPDEREAASQAGAGIVGGDEMIEAEIRQPIEAHDAAAGGYPAFGFDRWTTLPQYFGNLMKSIAGNLLRPWNLIPLKTDLLPQDQDTWSDHFRMLQEKPSHEMEFSASATAKQAQGDIADEAEQGFVQRLEALGEEVLGGVALKTTKAFAKVMKEAHKQVNGKTSKGNHEGGMESMMAVEEEIGNFRTVVATLRQLNADKLQYVEFQGSAGFSGGKLKLDQKDLGELCELAGVDLHFLLTLSSRLLGGDDPRKGQDPEDLKAEIKKKGLDGIDFAGAEAKFDLFKGKQYFKDVYVALKELGEAENRAYVLRPHAGEGYKQRERPAGQTHRKEATRNVNIITDAIRELDSDGQISPHVILRIGHGTHSDFSDLRALQGYGVIIEANLGSNKATGSADDEQRADPFAPTEKENTLLKFLYHGVETILSTDGGGVIGTTIQREYDVVEDIIERFRNNQIGFVMSPRGARFWFSEIPALVQAQDTEFRENILSRESQLKFDIRHVVAAAERYRAQDAPRLKKDSMQADA